MTNETSASWHHQVTAECERCHATEARTEEHLEVIKELEQMTPSNNNVLMRVYGFALLCRECRKQLSFLWLDTVNEMIGLHSVVLTDAQGEVGYYRKRYQFVPEDLHNAVSRSGARVKILRKARRWHFSEMEPRGEEE